MPSRTGRRPAQRCRGSPAGTSPARASAAVSLRQPRGGALLRRRIEELQIAVGHRKVVNITITNFRAVRGGNARDHLSLVERTSDHRPVKNPLGAEILAVGDAELVLHVLAEAI